MRVLLVEDEASIADFVSRGLSEQGYAVDVASDGDEALQWTDVAEFDLIILDVMLPRRDGLEVCSTLRGRRVQTPILMLTARDTVQDRVKGLDSGADDYLMKPFAFPELLARLRALVRRQPVLVGHVLEVADLQYVPDHHGSVAAGPPHHTYLQRVPPPGIPYAKPEPGAHADNDRRARLELRLRQCHKRH